MANKQGEKAIDYLDWTWNPVKGKCLFNCQYCYMKPLFKRFKWDETLRIDINEMLWVPRKPSRIGVCYNLDLFHPKVPKYWVKEVISVAWTNPQNTYLFLTKFPPAYGEFRFPENAWLGTTWDGLKLTEGNAEILDARRPLEDTCKFVSFEPLLAKPNFTLSQVPGIDWIIIGADSTRGAKKPPMEWATELIDQARDINIPVWVKDNYGYPENIKELPKWKTNIARII